LKQIFIIVRRSRSKRFTFRSMLSNMRAARVHIPKEHLETGPNEMHWLSFRRTLRARRRSPDTIAAYYRDLADLAWFHEGKDLAALAKRDIEDYLGDRLDRLAASTVAIRYRGHKAFFNWLVEEEVIEVSPMRTIREPSVDDVPPPVVVDEDLRALLKACSGNTFEDRRDTAILRLFCEAGSPRLGEMAGIKVDDVDLRADEVSVTGKGNKTRRIPVGAKTAQAIERYLRLRAKHPNTAANALFLATKKRASGTVGMTGSGIAQMLKRRCIEADIAHVHPHQLRHTAAHVWMDEGGSEGNAMVLFGWASDAMPKRYGRSARDARARRAAKKASQADRL
jgi:site-specific recombinase XerD